ncbi:hypothetical protein CCP4SC76_7810007 [Gammaproteobacteria bacterium]
MQKSRVASIDWRSMPRQCEIDADAARQHLVALITVPFLKSIQQSNNNREGKAPLYPGIEGTGIDSGGDCMDVGVSRVSRQRVSEILSEKSQHCEISNELKFSYTHE